MRRISLRSLLFISYTLILSILSTAYLENRLYLLNFYILPILFGAYYFDIYGGAILAILSTGLSLFFMHRAGNQTYDTPMIITQVVVFAIVGIVAGIFQRENNKLNNYFLKASLTDKLTNLYNYGYFTKRITEEVERAKRYKHTLGLIMIDVDHFKNYNDTYGHQNGNTVLVKIADILTTGVGKSNIVFRYGGEEFMIILPEVGEDAPKISEGLRQMVEKEIFPGNTHLTISAGVAYYPFPKPVSMDIIEQVDKSLYEAKESGRNRVCVFKG